MEEVKKKLYKGEVKTANDLLKAGDALLPIQPLKQTVNTSGWGQKLPPTFVATKFKLGAFPGHVTMHYIVPKSKQRGQIDVPTGFQFNVLSGNRQKELNAEYDALMKAEPWRLMKRLACTVGADPEIFVTKTVRKKKTVVPAWKFLRDKKNPDEYHNDYLRGTVYWDGFQAEFTTQAGVTCLLQFTDAIRLGLQRIHNLAPSGAGLDIASVVPIDSTVLASAADEHVAFGCAPSKNVYGLRGNTEEGRHVPYRFAGGHLHFGLTDGQKAFIPEYVRALDMVLGVACVSLFAKMDTPIRRQYYGLAGEYRTPPHGMEYRVLSNAWLAHPVITNMVFDLARAVCGLVEEGVPYKAMWKAEEKETLEAIMNHDVGLARTVLSRNEDFFGAILGSIGNPYNTAQGKKLAWRVWSGGMEELIDDPANLIRNWSIGKGKAWEERVDRNFYNVSYRGGKGKI